MAEREPSMLRTESEASADEDADERAGGPVEDGTREEERAERDEQTGKPDETSAGQEPEPSAERTDEPATEEDEPAADRTDEPATEEDKPSERTGEPATEEDEPAAERTDEPAQKEDEPAADETDEPAKKEDEPAADRTDEPAKKEDEPAAESPKKDREPRRGLRPSIPTFYVAGFWRRLLAALLDLGVVLPVSLLFAWIAGAATGIHLPPSRQHGLDIWLDLFLAADPALLGLIGFVLAVGAVYALVFQLTLGRTLGMRALKTRIIDVYGDEPSTLRAVVRTAGYLLGVATLGLGFVWIGFDREKRGVQDWISGTYVVKA